MKRVKVQYAKTHLSALLTSVERGEEVIIDRGNQPVARLVPIEKQSDRVWGFVAYSAPETFVDPLPEEQLVPGNVACESFTGHSCSSFGRSLIQVALGQKPTET